MHIVDEFRNSLLGFDIQLLQPPFRIEEDLGG